ncbi:MAG TPA: DNA-directed RNA polymerase subunit alpha [Candidatus Saccharimonadales bacterium]|nr:DNA-directed RNA polymerase subunit alpha [Candidatus Saccharimonadales bacterium]
MQNIANPKKIDFKTIDNPNEGIITIEPLFPGYGMTLGNSLRRVLLSSLPGAAVIGVKIKGAGHEFMALPHIKEDVLEMILNLKQLRLKVFTEEEIRLELKVKGKKVVTAGDITKNSEVEIKNPDLVIANITDEAGSLEAEILVKGGRGYKMSEGNKKENKEIGFIEIDSIFSPVTVVSIQVDNARVGKMTNWDKLVLNVKTDGTISPEDAFNEAIKILVEQYNALLPENIGKEMEVETASQAEAEVVVEAEVEEVAVEAEEEIVEPKKEKKEKVKKPKK